MAHTGHTATYITASLGRHKRTKKTSLTLRDVFVSKTENRNINVLRIVKPYELS